ncbi:MAG: hypothetical protein ACQGVK_06930 [Myxococcota bacterium]
MKPPHSAWPDLNALSALGFGPDTALMNDPKLFVDRRFLAALLQQLEQELGNAQARDTLFQIGLLHGLRDAERVLRGEFLPALPGHGTFVASSAAASTPLAMRLGARMSEGEARAITIPGCWPECYEADARLSRLGPADTPSCALSSGYTSGWLSGTLEAEILVVEEHCLAAGDSDCVFVAREVDGWRQTGDARAARLSECVDFDLFREVALARSSERLPELRDIEEVLELDGSEPVVHVWGPVMVMPYVDAEEALHAIDMLTRDPGTQEVAVVVVDLRNAVIDEGLGASVLEQVVDIIGSWGAEAILAEVNPLCEDAVASVESRHLLVRKDLPEAIAVAFQIAEAQARPQ